MGKLNRNKNQRRSAKTNRLTAQCERKEKQKKWRPESTQKTGRILLSHMCRIKIKIKQNDN
jgi:hypothetical protein